MFLFLATSTLILGLLLYVLYNDARRKYNLPAGPKGLPIVGNIFQLSKYPHHTYEKWKKTFGNLFYTRFGSNNVFVMNDIQLIKECFNKRVFNGRSDRLLFSLIPKGKNGVLLSEGRTWSEQRRFTLRHLRDFGMGKNYMESIIMEEVSDFIEGLKKEGNQPIQMCERFVIPVINAIWMIVAGKKFKHDNKDKLELIQDVERTFTKLSLVAILHIMAPFFLKIAPRLLGFTNVKNVAKRMHKMLDDEIEDHLNTLPEDPSNARDFIDAYLHEIKKTTDVKSSFFRDEGLKQLSAGIGDIFIAGSETTSTILSWTILYLVVHKEVQIKLQKHIDYVTGRSRPVTLADRLSLPYAEACVLEILRLSSIIVTGVFHTATHDTSFHGYDIPKGSWLMANQYGLHYDSKIWGDPKNFRPERFLSKDELTVVKNENLIPFSIGKRRCIGECLAKDEIFLYMTNIFQRFTIKLDPARPVPSLEAEVGALRKPQEFFVVLRDRQV